LSQLFHLSIHVQSASAPIQYKVFGDGGKNIVWLFYEPTDNHLTSITNSIETIFNTVLPALCKVVEKDFNNYMAAKTRMEGDVFLMKVLAAAARGFPMFSDIVLAGDLVNLVKSLSNILTDEKDLISALQTGPVYQFIPSERSLTERKVSYVQLLPVNGCSEEKAWHQYTVDLWQQIFENYHAEV